MSVATGKAFIRFESITGDDLVVGGYTSLTNAQADVAAIIAAQAAGTAISIALYSGGPVVQVHPGKAPTAFATDVVTPA